MAPVKHHHVESVGSTQDTARQLLDTNETLPFLVTATQQSAGQGRLGRIWISPPGNFYGSLVMKPTVSVAHYGEYSFLSALALRQTMTQMASGSFAFKWPNDILLGGRKCAGILIESYGAANECLIIGMGVNLRHAPPDDDVRTPAAALWPGAAPDRARDVKFTEAFIENFMRWHERYLQSGFDILRTEWLRHAYHLNQTITVNAPTEKHEGVFAGIDAQGNLLLTQDRQTRKITTADVALS